jgi:hypothetical protein
MMLLGRVIGARYGVERELRIVVDSAVSGVVCAVLLLMPRPCRGEKWESEVMLLRLPIVEKDRRPLLCMIGDADGEWTQGLDVKYSSSMRGLVEGDAFGDGVLASGRIVAVDASIVL